MNAIEDSNDIRDALLSADKKCGLGAAAEIIGIAGGEDELRKIMNSTGEMNVIDRAMFRIHLFS